MESVGRRRAFTAHHRYRPQRYPCQDPLKRVACLYLGAAAAVGVLTAAAAVRRTRRGALLTEPVQTRDVDRLQGQRCLQPLVLRAVEIVGLAPLPGLGPRLVALKAEDALQRLACSTGMLSVHASQCGPGV